MKVLFYSNQGLAPLHLGIELENLERLKAEGHEVFIVKCNNKLGGCYFNPCHNLLGCAICEARSDVFHKKINVQKEQVYSLKNYPEAEKVNLPHFKNLEELLDYKYDGVSLGRGVASSIISLRRDADINSNNENAFIDFQLRMAINVHLNFTHFIKEFKPDVLYFFNGRFAECFPLIGLAEKHNLPYTAMEVSSSKKRFELFENSLPHSIKKREQNLEKRWSESDPNTRDEIAQKWFEEKRGGTIKTGIVYTDAQKANQLPEGFDPSILNVAIFNSSEDEMKVIEEWKLDLYQTQNEVIEKVAKHFKGHPNIHFYLRVHPNLGKVNNAQSRGIENLKFDNLTVIPPASSVDTYALMLACDKSLSFGSNTGIEATYWQKPSILFGKSFYQILDCVYHPESYEALYQLIQDPDLKPKSKSSTYKHAYYVSTYGRPFKHFDYDGKFNSHYRKEKMERIYPRTVLYFFKYLYNFPKWIKYNYIVRRKSIFKSNIWKLR